MGVLTCGHESSNGGISVEFNSVDREGENCVVCACFCVECTKDLFFAERLTGDLNTLLKDVRAEVIYDIEKMLKGKIYAIPR